MTDSPAPSVGFRPVPARIAAEHLVAIEHAARVAAATDRPDELDPDDADRQWAAVVLLGALGLTIAVIIGAAVVGWWTA
jgi:hypothetical protein